jgi:hypothetical protein
VIAGAAHDDALAISSRNLENLNEHPGYPLPRQLKEHYVHSVAHDAIVFEARTCECRASHPDSAGASSKQNDPTTGRSRRRSSGLDGVSPENYVPIVYRWKRDDSTNLNNLTARDRF